MSESNIDEGKLIELLKEETPKCTENYGKDCIGFSFQVEPHEGPAITVVGKFSELPDKLQRKIAEDLLNQPKKEERVFEPEQQKKQGFLSQFFSKNS